MGNGISIRLATQQADFDRLRPLSLELHGQTRYSDIPYSFEKRDALFNKAITRPGQHALFIAEKDSESIGFLFCGAGEYIVGTEDIIATVISFFVPEKYRTSLLGGRAAVGLLKSAVNWSRARSAREIQVHATAGISIQRLDRFLRRSGFSVIGANYAFALAPHETAQ